MKCMMMQIIFSEQCEPSAQQEASGQVHLPAGLAWSSPVSGPEERLQSLSGNSSQNRSPVTTPNPFPDTSNNSTKSNSSLVSQSFGCWYLY